MQQNEIIKRCTSKLGMTLEQAKWVAVNLYDYALPDFSEWSWQEIDGCFQSVLFFKDKTDAEVLAELA